MLFIHMYKSLSRVRLFETPWTVACSLSGSSVHGILQARVLEWIAISFSSGSSRPRNRTQVSRIAGRRFWATREAKGQVNWTTEKRKNCMDWKTKQSKTCKISKGNLLLGLHFRSCAQRRQCRVLLLMVGEYRTHTRLLSSPGFCYSCASFQPRRKVTTNRWGKVSGTSFSKQMETLAASLQGLLETFWGRVWMANQLACHTNSVLNQAHLCMKFSLGISNFLERALVFPILLFPLFLCIDHLRMLSYLFLLFFGTLHSVGYIFSFLPCLSHLFLTQPCIMSSQTTALLLEFPFLRDVFSHCILYSFTDLRA